MDELHTQILEFLQIIIGGIISVAGVYVTMYINKTINLVKAKAENIRNEQAKTLVNNTLDNVDNLISTNIVAVENTIKPAILQAIANGTVDKSKLNSLSKIVKENVLNQLSTDGKEIFNSSLNDTDSYLQNRIEKILADLQSSDGTGVNKTTINTNINPTITASNTNPTMTTANTDIVQESKVTNSTSVDIPIESSSTLPK